MAAVASTCRVVAPFGAPAASRPSSSIARATGCRRVCRATPRPNRPSTLPIAASQSSSHLPPHSQHEKPAQLTRDGETADTVGKLSVLQRIVRACGQASALAAMGAAVLMANPLGANAAASGGRVGGSSFGTSRTTSSSSSTVTHSTTVVHSSPSVVVAPSPVVVAPSPVVYTSPVVPAYGVAGFVPFGGSFLIVKLLLLGLLAVLLIAALTGFMGGSAEEEEDVMGGPCTIVKLQVGLLGLARNLQADLDDIAQNADTDHPEGLQSVLQETTLSLLRNPNYCVYGYSELSQTPGQIDAEHKFNEQSLSERSKFSRETLVNYSGMSRSGSSLDSKDASNELIVVTLVAAVAGRLELPQINSQSDLKEALSKLGGVPSDALLALEVMWTPQQPGDSFSPDQLVLDYPHMNHL